MRIHCLLLSILVITGCTNQKHNPILNTGAIATQIIKINTTRDTIVRTANGALLKIEKGSFSGGEGEVELQLKEAYSFKDIVTAGLTTRSNGKPLSSDGMIYLKATDGGIKIIKPVNISLPTDDYDPAMLLFKGEEKEGLVNWVEPVPLIDTMSPYLQAGRNLFQQNCSSCHAYDKAGTGPAMKGLEARGPWSNRVELYKFTRDVVHYLQVNCYAKELLAQYGSVMPSFPQLSDQSLDAIYDYIKHEDQKAGVDLTVKQTSACQDSCRRFDSVRYKVEERVRGLQQARQALIDSNDLRINYDRLDSSGTGPMPNTRDREGLPEKVTPEDYRAIYYRFDITSFGWYNIDKLQEVAKDDETSLKLTVDESLSKEIDVFIAVPKYKVFDRGGKVADGVHYGFFTMDGKLPLPVGVKIVVFALGEADGKIIYDYKELISTAENEIALTPKLATKEEFNEAVKRFSLDRLSIEANNARNAGEIRKTDAEIKKQESIVESWKPKLCDCRCLQETDSTSLVFVK